MSALNLDDYPIGLEREPAAPPPRESKARLWPIAAVCVIIGAALIAFFVVRPSRGPGVAGEEGGARESRAPEARRPLGPDVPSRELPPLDVTDPLVRELLAMLSSRPELATWLATDGLIRNFVASVDAVANGATPTAQLRRLAPARPFTTDRRGDRFVIDPRSYARYDGIAATVASLDAEALARVYATLRPRMQEAYQELGYPDGDIDRAVERALARLLDTPIVGEDAEVHPAPVLYQFSDPAIERLSAAQKQLLRMGPRNQRVIQDKLREVGQALGATSR